MTTAQHEPQVNAISSQFTFNVPDEFVEVNLAESPDKRFERTYSLYSANMEGFTRQDLLAAAMQQEYLIMRLEEEGAVYCATCVARTEERVARLAICQFTVFVKEMDISDNGALSTLASGLKKSDGSRDVGFVDVPVGRVLVIADQVSVSKGTNTSAWRGQSEVVRQAQAIVPFPNRKQAAIMSISSESSAGWEEFLETFGTILGTVSFGVSGSSSIMSRLNA